MNKHIMLNNLIPESLAELRLDAALAKLFPDYSRAQIQLWIREGAVTINGETIKKTRFLTKTAQQVEIKALLNDQADWQAQDIPLNIIYEDDDLLVINKPVGLVVHPGAGNPDKTLVNALLHYLPSQATLPRAGIIHRLDKDTSGLLVIAKTLPAHHALVKMMQARDIQREYRALVHGHVISGGTIDAPIARHPSQRIKMAIIPNGKPAVTHYRVLERFDKHTLLGVTLETGRTHQIRVHLSEQGFPIVGDVTYGYRQIKSAPNSLNHQALHACLLSLIHPVTKEKHTWQAEMPSDMLSLITQLRKNCEE